MREMLVTSSGLILALLVLRRLFRKTLSRRVQYALWGLVLLRLLVPVNLPAADFSLLTAAKPVGQALSMAPAQAARAAPESPRGPYISEGAPQIAPGPPSKDHAGSDTDPNQATRRAEDTRQIVRLFRAIWYGGMIFMAGWLVLSNLRFWRKLRRARKPYAAGDSARRVYLVEEGLPSPCLFGLLRPAVYLTPAAVSSPESLRHVLAHEETHARHLDPVWSLLRGACLTIYWFDPLVWWAALASRTDSELACDEGALRRLGEAERIPYGKTLLALIPVRRGPGSPLLTATTMTAGKRRMADRITRIAENRTYLGRALFAALALAALACAVTFTGAKEETRRRLTEKELAYFNGDFFTETYGQGENRRRQFLTSLYDSPPNMDLYELLYNGTGLPEEITEEDRRYWENHFPGEASPEKDIVKLSVTNIEAFLQENTGFSARDNLRDWQGGFWWNEDNASYYNVLAPASDYELRRHPEPVVFLSGEREGGLVRLYYQGRLYGSPEGSAAAWYSGPLCLTLREKSGGWLFVSNEWDLAGQAHPDWEPLYTISLDQAEPYEPEAQEPLPLTGGQLEMLGGPEDPDRILGEDSLLFFRNDQGQVFAGVQRSMLSSYPPAFLALPGERYSVTWFRNLFGRDGFAIHCDSRVQIKENPPTYRFNGDPFTNYYYLTEDGQPALLASVPGLNPLAVDLDGDGERELVSQSAGLLYFRRDGTLFRAELDTLLRPFWPEDTIFSYNGWDAGSRSLSFRAWIYGYSDIGGIDRREYRTLYFDGENLLVYNDQRQFDSHLVEQPDLDHRVIEAVQEAVRQEFAAAGAPYDDWRITEMDWSRRLELDGRAYRIWQVSCEFHTPEPREMTGLDALDCWTDPLYPERLYLIFRNDAPEGGREDLTYCFSMRQPLWPTADQLLESPGLL